MISTILIVLGSLALVWFVLQIAVAYGIVRGVNAAKGDVENRHITLPVLPALVGVVLLAIGFLVH